VQFNISKATAQNFKDTKGVFRIRKSKERQYNDQEAKKANNNPRNITRKIITEQQ
jgi:hypothetical protein